MSKFSGASGEMAATTLLVLIAAVFVEIGGPIAWTVFQLSAPAKEPSMLDAELYAFKAHLTARLPERNGPTVAEFLGRTDPTPPNGGGGGGGRRGRRRDPNVVDFVHRFREANGRDPKIPEMREQFPQLDKATLWRNAKLA